MALSKVQHYANVLHCYCRLRDLGVPKPLARKIAEIYETLTHWILYRGRR